MGVNSSARGADFLLTVLTPIKKRGRPTKGEVSLVQAYDDLWRRVASHHMDPLEELLFWEEQRERQQRLDAVWPAFRRVTPKSIQKAVLYGRELNQTERIEWAGCRKKLKKVGEA